MKSYDYSHRSGVRRITWDGFASFAAHLAELLEPYQPQLILGVARAGLFSATAIACSLRRELFPIRLTRRLDDEVVYDRPVWKVPVPSDVVGKVVAVVDELVDTGQTLTMVVESTLALGAARVVTACLVAHTWASSSPGTRRCIQVGNGWSIPRLKRVSKPPKPGLETRRINAIIPFSYW